VICGLIAGGSGIAIFKAKLDPDPMAALALAPSETLGGTARLSPQRIGNSGQYESEQKAFKRTTVKPRCQSDNKEHLGSDCIVGQINRPRSISALNDRPDIPAVPIGRLDGLPATPSKSAIPVAVIPEIPPESASPVDVAPAADVPPAITEAPLVRFPAKTRTRSNYVQRRGSRSISYSKHYYQPNYQRGYARLW
jgi:hypothetical protein